MSTFITPDQSVREMVNMNSEIDGMDENLELAGVLNTHCGFSGVKSALT